MNITTIGIDLAKNTLSLHGVEWSGQAGIPQDLEPCEVAAVPGFTAAVPHRLWRPVPEPISLGRELMKFSYRVGIMAPKFVAVYRKLSISHRSRYRRVSLLRHMRAITLC